MPVKLIKYSFSAGVFARALHGRSDLEKYSLGLAEAHNFFIDYRGGATSRAGTEFIDCIDTTAVRFFAFRFNRTIANTYLIVFTPSKIRFIQDGGFVLEASKAITDITAGTVTAAAHGYSNGDWVQIGGRTLVVTNATTNTFETHDINGAAVEPSGSEAFRVYTLASTFTADQLPHLQFRQRRDSVTITSNAIAPMQLIRSGHTSWTLQVHDTGGSEAAVPVNITANASSSGSASTNVVVTSVDNNGRETTLDDITFITGIVNYTDTAGSLQIEWTPAAGARYYNIYRALVFPSEAQNSLGQQLGYIGRSYAASFTDVNIVPDFTRSPQFVSNPLHPGQILHITVTNGGTGYTTPPDVNITSGGSGTGFRGLAIIKSGVVTGVIITHPGRNFAPGSQVTFTGGGGSGATGTVSVSGLTGTYPAVSIYYGQRLWFLGTEQYPMAIYSGRGDDVYSFNRSQLTTANDPFELEIDSPELTPIRFAETLVDNMFIFTDLGVWQMAPTNQGYGSVERTKNGIGVVPPLPIDNELIFTLPDGSGVRAIRPGQVPNSFNDIDLTIFSGDFFSRDQEIVSWAFARTPFRMVWAVKRDGQMLSFTYVPEHNVYAWAEHSTQGNFLECAVVPENGIDRLYVAVERDNCISIERMAKRDFETVEDIWSVDAALANELVSPAATVTVTDNGDETLTLSANTAIFTSGDIGKYFRAGGGLAVVTAFVNGKTVRCETITPIEERKNQSTDFPPFAEGEWTLDPLQTEFGGLHHLAGKLVQVFGDGSYVGDFTVSAEGTVTLPSGVSKAIIGLPFDGTLRTLPSVASDSVIDDRVKRPTGLALRLEKTRGLKYGDGEPYYELKERTNENYGQPTRFQDGLRGVTMRANWRADDSFVIRKEGPGAVSLLGYIIDVELGDDPD